MKTSQRELNVNRFMISLSHLAYIRFEVPRTIFVPLNGLLIRKPVMNTIEKKFLSKHGSWKTGAGWLVALMHIRGCAWRIWYLASERLHAV